MKLCTYENQEKQRQQQFRSLDFQNSNKEIIEKISIEFLSGTIDKLLK